MPDMAGTQAPTNRPTTARAGWFGIGVQTGLFVLYCAAYFAVRLAWTSALEQDAAVRHFEAGWLALSYPGNDPPLYTWLLLGLHRLVGLGLHSTMLLNYALMTGAFWALLVSARMVLGDKRWSALAAWSLMLFPPVLLGHFALAHTTHVLCAGALALLAALRLVRHGRAIDYLLLGAAVGFGLMAKHNFALLVAAIVLAALAQPATRTRLFSAWTLAAGAAAVLVAAPLLLALADALGQATAAVGNLGDQAVGPVQARLVGLASAAGSLLAYCWPMLLVLLVAAPRALAPMRSDPAAPGSDPVLSRFVRDVLIAGLLVMALVVLVTGTTSFPERYMQPVLFALPLYAVGRVLRIRPDTGAWRRYAGGMGVVAVVAFGLRLLELSPLCPQACRDLVPYDRLAAHLRAEGFSHGTIVTGSSVAAGNLRVHFPEARVLVGTTPSSLPRPEPGSGQCLAVWDMTDWGPEATRARALDAVGLGDAAAAPLIRSVALPWHWPFFSWTWPPTWPPTWSERRTEWQYLLLQDGARCP